VRGADLSEHESEKIKINFSYLYGYVFDNKKAEAIEHCPHVRTDKFYVKNLERIRRGKRRLFLVSAPMPAAFFIFQAHFHFCALTVALPIVLFSASHQQFILLFNSVNAGIFAFVFEAVDQGLLFLIINAVICE